MSQPLAIALVSPHAWPARDDLAWHVEQEADALARRGHRVTILAPASGRERLAEGRARLRALDGGHAEALLAPPGEPMVVAIGRALPTGGGRRLGGPFDLAAGLERALAAAPFDVVHLHEPLAPSPALSSLRHARGVTAATFHRTEPLAGVAFLRPLVDRALARVDLRMAASEAARRALAEVLPGEYALLAGGVDLEVFRPPAAEPDGPPGLVVIARGRDRTGVRFALRALRGLDLSRLGPVTVLGAAEAPWRTRAAVPKAMRGAVTAVADAGPVARAQALARGRIALVATPEDAAGPVLREAMATGMAVIAPRSVELEDVLDHGREGLVLPPFSLDAWAEAAWDLARDASRRREIGGRAARRARARDWSLVAAELEARYRDALRARAAAPAPAGTERILADLRVRPGPTLSPSTLLRACAQQGLGAVVVAGRGGIGPALAARSAAAPDLTVIVGQEIATAEGVVVGLFLTRAVADGLPLAAALAEVHAQGGLVMLPHPALLPAPSPEALRACDDRVDCHEVLAGAAGNGWDEDGIGLARRMGLLPTAGSGAASPVEVGAAFVRLRPFHGPSDFLDALADAELMRRRRGRLARTPGRQRRPRRRP